MNTILRNTRPTAKQMYLDPRTKILLCLTVSCVMMSSDIIGIMRFVLPCLAAIPLLFLVFLKKTKIAAYYVVMYIDASCVATVQPPFHRYDCHVYKAAARDVHVLPFDINNNGK